MLLNRWENAPASSSLLCLVPLSSTSSSSLRLVTVLTNSITRPISRCLTVNWQDVANDQMWRWINVKVPECPTGEMRLHLPQPVPKTKLFLPLAPMQNWQLSTSPSKRYIALFLSAVHATRTGQTISVFLFKWEALSWVSQWPVPYFGRLSWHAQTTWFLKALQHGRALNSCRVYLLPSQTQVFNQGM